jgi:hypothetical protein
VAVCDRCGRLLLGYTSEGDFTKTQEELGRHHIPFEATRLGAVLVIAKDRTPVGAGNGGEDVDLAAEEEDDDEP